MNNIQIEEVNSTLSEVVSEGIQYLKQHLNDILVSSDRTLIENLIEETKFSLEQAKSNSQTYQEKYNIFNQITNSWLDAWHQYKDIPGAINLISLIDYITNYSVAYSYLCLSLSYINEGRVGEYKADLERTVSGFSLLSEIVDVFVDFFSISELKQLKDGARNAISVSNRSVKEYFENSVELSNLVTQLRAYSSLIVLKVEKYINIPEEHAQEGEALTAQELTPRDSQAEAESAVSLNKQLRPFGLCAGKFIVPDDFDAPLPEEILSAFEG